MLSPCHKKKRERRRGRKEKRPQRKKERCWPSKWPSSSASLSLNLRDFRVIAASLASQRRPEAALEVFDDEDLTVADRTHKPSLPMGQTNRSDRREEQKHTSSSIAAKVSGPPTPPMTSTYVDKDLPVDGSAQVPKPWSGLLGDRAQLEKERLARQATRAAQTSGVTGTTNAISAQKGSTEAGKNAVATSSRVVRVAGPAISSNGHSSVSKGANEIGIPKSTNHPLQSSGLFPSDTAGEYYLDGEMRHTALTIGDSSKERTFSLAQVIGKVGCASVSKRSLDLESSTCTRRMDC